MDKFVEKILNQKLMEGKLSLKKLKKYTVIDIEEKREELEIIILIIGLK